MTGRLTKNILAVMIAAVMILIAVAAVNTDRTYADESGYRYRVTVYSGNQGTFNGKKKWEREYDYGEQVYITLDELGFKAKKKSKYYVRGFRIAGHDNDETTGFQTMTFEVTEDVDYELAYGIKGSMVAYTARYLEKGTDKEVHAPDTFYGMPGDKPVISFRYVDGYEPDTYNITRTLSENEDDNNYTFYYTKIEGGGNGENGEGGNGGNGDNGGNGNGPAAPGTAGNPAGTNVNNGRNINNDPVPRAPGNGKDDNGKKQTTDIDKNKTPKAAVGMDPAILTGITAGILFLLLLLILFLLKRRNSEKEEDDA